MPLRRVRWPDATELFVCDGSGRRLCYGSLDPPPPPGLRDVFLPLGLVDCVERFAGYLHLPYEHFAPIRNLWAELYGDSSVFVAESAALAVHLYCKRRASISVSITAVAAACGVSVSFLRHQSRLIRQSIKTCVEEEKEERQNATTVVVDLAGN